MGERWQVGSVCRGGEYVSLKGYVGKVDHSRRLSTSQHNTSDRIACPTPQGRGKSTTQRENITRQSYLSGNPIRPIPIPACPFIPSLQTVPKPHYRAMRVRDGVHFSEKTRNPQTARLNQESEAAEHQCHAKQCHAPFAEECSFANTQKPFVCRQVYMVSITVLRDLVLPIDQVSWAQ